MTNEYDVVVIGAGTGGYVAAIRAAQLGLKVACVERYTSLGGTCLNWGCIPTKALLEHAHAFKIAQESATWGISFGKADVQPSIDMTRVHARKDKIVTGITKGVEFLFKKNKITWVKGTARLAGKGTVEVTGAEPQTLKAREIVVATGSAPRSVPGIEIDKTNIITSDQAIHLPAVPKSIAIMGSGAVGVEFASIFRRFGSEVTLIELLPRIVPNEDEAVSAELDKAFRKRGIAVRAATKVTSAKVKDGSVTIEMQSMAGKTESLTIEKLLVATGRGPVTDGLGAAEAGLTLERGFIKVDNLFRTGVPGISAIGDVITMGTGAHAQLAHLSSAEGIVLAERLAGRDVQPIDYEQVPACTYCEPEIGSIGLTEKEAADRGYDVRVGTFPFGVLGRAKMAGEVEGFVKIVAEKKYDEVLGVHMIGLRATELVAEAAVALRLESTVEELIRTIHAHPTMSEAVGEAAHAVHGAAIHI
ncbi:MAG TPA: dihydrolipoyl dehydrogenase [Vicinamibacterales bacterium]|nr:dihydrolipoyl dehydrogenase [Vicinamibacterales bacterium]